MKTSLQTNPVMGKYAKGSQDDFQSQIQHSLKICNLPNKLSLWQ